MKNWTRLKKRLGVLVVSAMVMSMLCVSAFAAEGDTAGSTATIVSAFTTGFQGIVSDAISMIAAAVPIALSLAAVIFLTRKAMSWFKSMAK